MAKLWQNINIWQNLTTEAKYSNSAMKVSQNRLVKRAIKIYVSYCDLQDVIPLIYTSLISGWTNETSKFEETLIMYPK